MNPLAQRISAVEDQLVALKHKATSLSRTVDGLKKDLTLQNSAETKKTEPLPKPLPEPLPAPAKIAEPPLKKSPATLPPPSTTNFPTKEEVAGIEMQLGRVWSVRLGILLLTTGFVFLSRYTYDNFVRDLGPGFRLTMMYLFSFLLTGAGLFCERWKDSLKSYGRIVAAGGLAAIYYCGFAAHNIEALRVIESPVFASLILTLSAGLFCAASLWRESRVMLSTSLALAFYSISVNPIGWMTCFSAVILAAFGISMMIKYRWVEVGFVVLIGSYLSYIWWQFGVSQSGSDATRWFLLAYWLLFTTAALFARRDLSKKHHIGFSTFNNSAFFFLFSFQLESASWMNQHWLFCLIFGTTLIILGLTTKTHFSDKLRTIHLIKGLGIFTLGLALYLDGHHLFIALLIEALVLMALTLKYPSPLTKSASWIIAALSCLSCIFSIETSLDTIPPWAFLFATLAWLTLGNLQRLIEAQPKNTNDIQLNPGALAASIIALIFLVFGLMSDWQPTLRILVLALLGTLATWASLSSQIRNSLFDTLSVFHCASFIGLLSLLQLSPLPQIPTFLAGSILALLISIPPFLFSQRATSPEKEYQFHLSSGAFLAVSLALLSFAIFQSELSQSLRLSIILILPIAGTLIAHRTKSIVHSTVPFLMHLALFLIDFQQAGLFAISVVLLAIHLTIVVSSHRLQDHDFLKISLTILTSFFWACLILDLFPQHPALPLTLTGIALILTKKFSPKYLHDALSIPFLAVGFAHVIFFGPSSHLYLCLIAPLALHLTNTYQDAPVRYHLLAIVSLLLFWLQITDDTPHFPVAATWAITGTIILLTGLALKSRCFRLTALVMLLASLGHLMIIDLIKLEALPRILSFMTLGLGLLALGFVYNRYQDRLKQIL